MSQTKAQLVSGTTAQNLTVDNINTTSVNNNQASGKKNLIINGGHNIAQRGTAAVTVNTSALYRCVDRWKTDIDGSGGGDFSHGQATDAPDGVGLTNSSKITVVTQASQPSSEGNRHQLYYQVEKNDVAKLCWGTSSAKACTLSFYVKSSITGTYPMSLQFYGAGGNLYYFFNYTIDSANTWERKTINITGPTTGGNISAATANVGLRIEWGLGYGSDSETGTLNEWTSSGTTRTASGTVYLPENSGATWFLTGCQFEIGSTATDFEHRPFADELALCQRYFTAIDADGSIDNFAPIAIGRFYNSFQAQVLIALPTTMRQPPTIEASSTTAADTFAINSDGTFSNQDCNAIVLNERSFNAVTLTVSSGSISGQTTGMSTTLYCHDSDVAKIGLTAEL